MVTSVYFALISIATASAMVAPTRVPLPTTHEEQPGTYLGASKHPVIQNSTHHLTEEQLLGNTSLEFNEFLRWASILSMLSIASEQPSRIGTLGMFWNMVLLQSVVEKFKETKSFEAILGKQKHNDNLHHLRALVEELQSFAVGPASLRSSVGPEEFNASINDHLTEIIKQIEAKVVTLPGDQLLYFKSIFGKTVEFTNFLKRNTISLREWNFALGNGGRATDSVLRRAIVTYRSGPDKQQGLQALLLRSFKEIQKQFHFLPLMLSDLEKYVFFPDAFGKTTILQTINSEIMDIPRPLSPLLFLTLAMLDPDIETVFLEQRVPYEPSYSHKLTDLQWSETAQDIFGVDSILEIATGHGWSDTQIFKNGSSTRLEEKMEAQEFQGFKNDQGEEELPSYSMNSSYVEEFSINDSYPKAASAKRLSVTLIPQSKYAFPLQDLYRPNDALFPLQWSFKAENQYSIFAEPAWKIHLDSAKAFKKPPIIAMIDTGCDISHPDLTSNIWKNEGEICGNGIDDDANGYVDDCFGWDFVQSAPMDKDESGHGTGVAGLAAASTDNSIGIAGLCPLCKAMCLRVIKDEDSAWIYSTHILKAINYALSNGATVSSNSWGIRHFVPELFSAVSRAKAAGHLFIFAAGNTRSNNDASASFFPASFPSDNVISVGSSHFDGNRAKFSNYGKHSVDLFAPGTSMMTLFPGGNYKMMSGTSFSVPLVSATAGMLKYISPNLPFYEIKRIILSTVTPVDSLQGSCKSGGILNAYDASSLALLWNRSGSSYCETGRSCDTDHGQEWKHADLFQNRWTSTFETMSQRFIYVFSLFSSIFRSIFAE